MSQASFWDNSSSANKLVAELKDTKAKIELFLNCEKKYQDLKELIALSESEAEDFIKQIQGDLEKLKLEVSGLEFITIFSGEFDRNNCFLSINAGAGGTEACDWVNMLLRMYSRYAQNKNFKLETTDVLPGEEAGIKNVTLRIVGDFAFGYLKSERGVHRLVRISPFDANKRRHTSFASVDVIPEIEDDIEVAIKPEELKIDVFRSSGPGGQSVNTTDSAIRITHIPTGIVVACQNERSQYQNKQTAMKILRSRLFELKQKEQEEKLGKIYSQKQKIEWGSQIRSYVLHPYSMVKDHRTDIETGNAQAILDGNLDMFIEGFLKLKAKL